MTSFYADLSPLTHRFLRQRALKKLLGDEALGDARGVPGGARDDVAEDLMDREPTDEIVAGLRNDHGLDPETELQTRLRLEDNREKVDDILRAKNLQDAGIDTSIKDLVRARLMRSADQLSPAQQVNAANERDVAPFDFESGTLFDRYEGSIAEENAPNQALALERQAGATLDNVKAQHENLRLQAIERIFGDPNTDPLIAADIANDKEVSDATPETVSVIGEDGKRQTRTARRRPDGSFVLDTARDSRGQGVRLANEPKPDNTRQVKSPVTVWRDSVGTAQQELKREPRYRNQAIPPEILRERATEIFRLQMNDDTAQPPASGDIVQDLNARAGGGESGGGDSGGESSGGGNSQARQASASGQGNGANQADLDQEQQRLLQQARNAVNNGKDPIAVRQKLRDLGINPDLL